MIKFKVVRLCKNEAMSVVPTIVIRFQLDKAAKVLESNGYVVVDHGPMITATKGGVEVTLYKSGRLLVHPANTKEETGEVATTFYETVEVALEPTAAKSA